MYGFERHVNGKEAGGFPLRAHLELSANCYISLFKHRPTQSSRLYSLRKNMMPSGASEPIHF